METYHKIQTLFKRDMDGSLTGKKGTMLRDQWSTPELAYLANNEWEFTEKVDGTNIRVFIRRVEDSLYIDFAGRTDNAVLPKPLLERLSTELFPNHPTKAMPSAQETRIHDWMGSHGLNWVQLFGEGYGPKIQNGGNYGTEQDFVLFDVKVGDFWLDRASVDSVAEALGLKSVPVIGYGTLHDAIDLVETGYHNKGQIFNVNRHGEHVRLISTWGNFEAEGIVARPRVPLFNRKGERIICKIKGVDFK